MSKAWIETYSGGKFDILDPEPDQFSIEDIAHSLSLLCRFTGHCKFFYSVAQHSYLGSYLVPEKDALWFLLHDASEAFIGDANRPLKHFTDAGKAYQTIEANIMRVICKKFGLPGEQPASVHEADNAMLFAEKDQIMQPMEWGFWGDQKSAPVRISEQSPREAELCFLGRFYQLKKER
jgi:hypothetical protein